MSLNVQRAWAKMATEAKGKKITDDKQLAVKVRIQVKTTADFLAEFHPELRTTLFNPGGGVKFKAMDAIGWQGLRKGVEIEVRDGPDLLPKLKLLEVDCSKFKLKPIDEGGEQLVLFSFLALIKNPGTLIPQILSYLDQEIWIDMRGVDELDLPPPPDPALDATKDAARAAITKASTVAPPKTEDVAAVRRLQVSKKGAKQKLATYPDAVLRAAIAAENENANPRALFIAMLEGELERRLKESPTGGNA